MWKNMNSADENFSWRLIIKYFQTKRERVKNGKTYFKITEAATLTTETVAAGTLPGPVRLKSMICFLLRCKKMITSISRTRMTLLTLSPFIAFSLVDKGYPLKTAGKAGLLLMGD